jgi:beta propeller repeat protein
MNRRAVIFAFLLAAAAALLAAAVAPAPAAATMVVGHFNLGLDKPSESHAALDHGIVVYQKQASKTGWDIYGYDLATKKVFPICTAKGDQVEPDISYPYVVWQDSRNGGADVYGYDLGTKTEFPVCTDKLGQLHPRVSGDHVVWEQKLWSGSQLTQILGTTIGTPGTYQIWQHRSASQHDPDVSGDYVVWVDMRGGHGDIWGYSYSADYAFPICANTTAQRQPAIDGDTVVWSDARGGTASGTDIYGYDLTTSSEFPVCVTVGYQAAPSVSGDIVTWADRRTAGDWNIVADDLTLEEEFYPCLAGGWQGQPAVSGDTVLWTDHRTASLDLRGVTLSPWDASIRINGGAIWTTKTKVTLDLWARSKTGIVTGVTPDDGSATPTPRPYATAKPWTLSGDDGVKTVKATFTDLSGTVSPTVRDTIVLDTTGPSTFVPKAVTAVAGRTATITYRVDDALSQQADAVIRVYNKSGAIVKVLQPGWVDTGKALTQTFTCALAPGTYQIKVTAIDEAGNAQVKVGHNTLTVTR